LSSAFPSVGRSEIRTLARSLVSLGGRWTDPDFDPAVRAFYYARIIEIPTSRWSTYDAERLGIAPPEPPTVQERGWTSLIWYTPSESDRAAGLGGERGRFPTYYEGTNNSSAVNGETFIWRLNGLCLDNAETATVTIRRMLFEDGSTFRG
jgi:hypothetical protein